MTISAFITLAARTETDPCLSFVNGRFSFPLLYNRLGSQNNFGDSTKALFQVPVINALTAWEGPILTLSLPSPAPSLGGGPSDLLAPQRTSSSHLNLPRNLPGVAPYLSFFGTIIVPASQDGEDRHSGLTGP